MSLWTRIKNKWIGDDPNPQPSILDVLDARGTVPLTAEEDDAAWEAAEDAVMNGEQGESLFVSGVYWSARQREAAKRSAWS